LTSHGRGGGDSRGRSVESGAQNANAKKHNRSDTVLLDEVVVENKKRRRHAYEGKNKKTLPLQKKAGRMGGQIDNKVWNEKGG